MTSATGGGGREAPPVIRSALLEGIPSLSFGISTRAGGASAAPYGLNLSFRVGDAESDVRANRELFFGALEIPLDRLAIPTQIHGSVVRYARLPGNYEECDGLVTRERGIYLAVSVADCVPVFLYDPVRQAVAAIHAGWRGSRMGIVLKGIDAMREECGSAPEQLMAVVGQSAGVCCYEIGEDVAREFDAVFVLRNPGKKPHLDLHAHTLDALVRAGLLRERIELATSCTICHPAEFHSYRRERERSGRMMGVIGLR